MPEIQTVDPAVSRAKFDRQIGWFQTQAGVYRAQGCFLIERSFPTAFFIFAPPKIKPQIIGAAVEIDFSNYDLPTSVGGFRRPLYAPADCPEGFTAKDA
ncbi:putative metal-binding protein [Mesorhizobium sp. SEMIA 3007]|uniref:putative metal-binding protein n=1 Tax=Mesorhizobium sp. SEMIA 3007 TaxID=1862350 RepID=UPI001FD9D242|nr:putative metal-binding protein [Mesorhizobium sp. SEMIA 3007]